MKVYELAKEFGVKSNVIVDMIQDTSDKKITATSILTEDQIDFINVEMETIKAAEEKAKAEEEAKVKVKTDKDYAPDEMIRCHSIFHGTLHFTGRHTGITYTFFGAGDYRNVEYQDLKAAMLSRAESIFNPDIVIDDENLLADEHWLDVRQVYEDMFDEKAIKKVLNLPTREFEQAFIQLPMSAKQTIITIIASQIEDGTFEQYNKARIIDKICGTRFDLTMN